MPDLSRGSRSSSRLILSWAPSGFVSGSSGSPSRMCSTHGATFDEHERRLDGGRAAGGVEVDLVELVTGPDRRDAGADADLGPGRRSRPGQRVAERAHAAQGHQLLAGAVADQSVEEAAVLLQRRVEQRAERPDQRVGRHDAAHGVVGEPLLDHLAQRRGDEVAPGRLVHVRGQVLLPGQRLQEGRLDRPRHLRHLGVEAAPRVVLAAAVGQLEERGTGALALRVLDQQLRGAGRRGGTVCTT